MKSPKDKLFRAIIVVAVIGLIYFGYSRFFTSSKSSFTYQTATVTQDTLVTSLTASGQVAATNSRTVTTTASGVVKKVFVKEGQAVRTGTPIMQIDLDLDGLQKYQSAYSQYLSAQNSLKTAQDKIYNLQATLTSTKNIFDNQYSSLSPDDPSYIVKHNDYLTAQVAYDNYQKTVVQAQTSLESARLNYQLSSPTVYAPISGTVSAISLTQGMILNPTSTAANSSNSSNKIAIVKTTATPAVTVNLSEIDVPKVRVGQKATIVLDAYSDKTFSGKVIAVDTSGVVSSNVVSYPTTIQFDNNVDGILSNMSATVHIITSVVDSALLVPVSAVKNSQVQVYNSGKPVSVDVTTGASDSVNIQITSGLSVGDTIVTSTTSSSSTSTSSTRTSVFGNTRIGGFSGGPRN